MVEWNENCLKNTKQANVFIRTKIVTQETKNVLPGNVQSHTGHNNTGWKTSLCYMKVLPHDSMEWLTIGYKSEPKAFICEKDPCKGNGVDTIFVSHVYP